MKCRHVVIRAAAGKEAKIKAQLGKSKKFDAFRAVVEREQH